MAIYPLRATMWHDQATVTVGGSIYNAHDSSQDHAKYVRINPANNGDTFSQSFVLAAGTYTFCVLGCQGTTSGKMDWYVDDVLIASGEDWYYNPVTQNTLFTHTGVTITGDGRHVLKGIINGKNASSSGYYANLTKYWFQPAADTVSVA